MVDIGHAGPCNTQVEAMGQSSTRKNMVDEPKEKKPRFYPRYLNEFHASTSSATWIVIVPTIQRDTKGSINH